MNTILIHRCKQLFDKKLALSEIAKEVGCSSATVSRIKNKCGWTRELINKSLTDEELLNNLNLDTISIAKKFNTTKQTILYRMSKLGIKRNHQEETEKAANKYRKHFPDLHHFHKMTNIGSYYLGLLFADGSLEKNGAVSIALKNDDGYIIKQLCEDIKISKDILSYSNKNATKFSIKNSNFRKFMKNNGFNPHHDYKLLIPKNVKPDHFLRGYIDGDGSILIKHRNNKSRFLEIRIYCTYIEQADLILKLIRDNISLDINGPYQTKSIWVITASHLKAEKLASWVWKNPSRCLLRKYSKYLEYISH